VRRCGRGVADVRASCAARERGAERRALKAERTGVRGWAAALKVEQASVEHQLAGRIGGLPSRSGRAEQAKQSRPSSCARQAERGKGRDSWAEAGKSGRRKGGAAGLVGSCAGLKREEKNFFSKPFFFLFCFQSQFKSKPIVNLNRVLNILFISNIIEQFW